MSSVKRWLGRLSPSTGVVGSYNLNRFLKWMRENGGEFAGMTVDDLVEYQKRAVGEDRYRVLDVVQDYIGGMKGRYGYKRKAYSVIRSFFMHNRAELPRDPSFRVKGDIPKVMGSLTVEEVRRIVLSSKPCYQAVFLCMFQGGMGREEWYWWNMNGWPSLRKALKRDDTVIRVGLPGRKRMRNIRPYYTYIGRDAVEAVWNWLNYRPSDATAIFTDQRDKPVSSHAAKQYWDRHLLKLGLIKPRPDASMRVRYGKNPHEMRDLFRTRWQKSGAAPEVAEFLMGHIIDPLEYNKAMRDRDYTSMEYMKAEPWLNIMSEEPEKMPVRDHQMLVRQYEEQNRRLREAQERALQEVIRRLEALERTGRR